ncbi:MAG: hypothetical protein HZA14_12015, partial [Nitrospirae bacterium]|nr:hypothetical protein [Nitrospirota bacterium]
CTAWVHGIHPPAPERLSYFDEEIWNEIQDRWLSGKKALQLSGEFEENDSPSLLPGEEGADFDEIQALESEDIVESSSQSDQETDPTDWIFNSKTPQLGHESRGPYNDRWFLMRDFFSDLADYWIELPASNTQDFWMNTRKMTLLGKAIEKNAAYFRVKSFFWDEVR